MVETMDEVEEVKVEVFHNIWVRRDLFRSEDGEGEEGPAEPAVCVGGGIADTAGICIIKAMNRPLAAL